MPYSDTHVIISGTKFQKYYNQFEPKTNEFWN